MEETPYHRPTIDDYIDALDRKIKTAKSTLPITDFKHIHLNRKQLKGLKKWLELPLHYQYWNPQRESCPFTMRTNECEICTKVFNITHPRSDMGKYHRKCPCSIYNLDIVTVVAQTYIAFDRKRHWKAVRTIAIEFGPAAILVGIVIWACIKCALLP